LFLAAIFNQCIILFTNPNSTESEALQ